MKKTSSLESLFWKLFNSDTEAQVQALIQEDELLRSNENWFPYGGENKSDYSNFAIFEAQMPQPVPALVEKITNSVDSILMKECRLTGVDPRSAQAPRTMASAVESYFAIKNGDFSEVSRGKRREVAENIQVIATGERDFPSIVIYDNGEGQHPDNFPTTFLSLPRGDSNKINIPFVQGKYRMGSTGAVLFCGDERYQLIASRLNEQLRNGKDDVVGFTLVRRHPLSAEEEATRRSTWYEYLILPDGSIPRFSGKNLDLGLSNSRPFVSGSIVKLYSYQLQRGSKSDITLDLWRELNQNLYSPALPILLYEKRFERGHSPTKLMLGNKTRIAIDDRDKVEKTMTFKHSSDHIGDVVIEATVFRSNVPQREFINEKAVVFTLNGQVQGSLRRGFISKELGYSWLKESLLINVDCTNIKTSFRQDLFMSNRFNMREGKKYEEFIDLIIEMLKVEELRQINRERSNRISRDNAQSAEILESLVNSIPLEKEFLELLEKGGNLNFLKNKKKKDAEDDREETLKKKQGLKRYPSIFRIRLQDNKEGKKVKSIPLNGKGYLEFETDVEDDYFFRPKDPGDLNLEILDVGSNGKGGGGHAQATRLKDVIEVTRSGPSDGIIRITFRPKTNLSVGDELRLSAQLTSPSGDLESIFFVKVADPNREVKPPKEKQKDERPNLPKPIKVFKEADEHGNPTWIDFNWDGNDVVSLRLSEDGKTVSAIAVNMDGFALSKFLSKRNLKTKTQLRYIKDKYFIDVYLHSLYLYSLFRNGKELDTTQAQWECDSLIPNIFKSYTTFLLYATNDDSLLKVMGEED